MKLFPQLKSDKTAAQVDRHRKILAAAEAELEGAEILYRAVIDASVTEDGDHMEKITSAASTRERAREKRMLAEAMVKAAENAHKATLESVKEKAIREQWAKCEAIAEKRAVAAELIERQIEALRENLAGLNTLSAKLRGALPANPRGVDPADVGECFRKEMARHGFKWALPRGAATIVNASELPSLTDSIQRGNEWALSKRTEKQSSIEGGSGPGGTPQT